MAGVPVYAQPGRNGGWSLLGEARTDLTGLTADEARALFLVAGPSARVAPEAKAALRKLVRALPEPFRRKPRPPVRPSSSTRRAGVARHRPRRRPSNRCNGRHRRRPGADRLRRPERHVDRSGSSARSGSSRRA